MADHPVSFEKIAKILKDSAYDRFLKDDRKTIFAWNELRRLFPGLVFVENEFSFENSYNRKLVFVGKLLGAPFFKPKDQETEPYKDAQFAVNIILNSKKELESMTSDSYIQLRVNKINAAIERRNDHAYDNYKSHYKASEKLKGTYEFDQYFIFVITNDPIDVFMKSTGRTWEKQSCERVNGEFESGVYSDIEWCNFVVYLCDKNDTKNPIARVMVRNCETENGEDSFGIEPVWYSARGRLKDDNDKIEGTTIRELDERLVQIIEEQGFPVDYGSCITPYVYTGYSDYMRHGNMEIEYGAGAITISDIFKDITFASKCPFCSTYNEWSADVIARTSVKAILRLFDNLHDKFAYNGYAIDNVHAEYVDDNLFDVGGGDIDADCRGCGSKIIVYNLSSEYPRWKKKFPISTSKKYIFSDLRFRKLGKEAITTMLSYNDVLKSHVIKKIGYYPNFIRYLKSSKLDHAFLAFLLAHELSKDEKARKRLKRRDSYLYKREMDEPGIVVDEKINAGRDYLYSEDRDVCIYIDDEKMDYDFIVERFVKSKIPAVLHEQLLLQKWKTDTSKFKKLEKFCRK